MKPDDNPWCRCGLGSLLKKSVEEDRDSTSKTTRLTLTRSYLKEEVPSTERRVLLGIKYRFPLHPSLNQTLFATSNELLLCFLFREREDVSPPLPPPSSWEALEEKKKMLEQSPVGRSEDAFELLSTNTGHRETGFEGVTCQWVHRHESSSCDSSHMKEVKTATGYS